MKFHFTSFSVPRISDIMKKKEKRLNFSWFGKDNMCFHVKTAILCKKPCSKFSQNMMTFDCLTFDTMVYLFLSVFGIWYANSKFFVLFCTNPIPFHVIQLSSFLFYPTLLLFYSIQFHSIPSHSILFYFILPYPVLSCSILFFPILSYHILSYLFISYLILANSAMSCPVLSCFVLFLY